MPLTVLELNPQTRPQYGFPRRNGATASGTIGIHTAENRPDLHGPDTGAEDVAQFILTRPDFGSYHCVCDSDSIVRLAPFATETWGIRSLNNWAIHIAAAVTTEEWATLPTERRDRIMANMAAAAAEAAQWCFDELGIVVPARRLTRAEAEARKPGFVAHADADPTRRTDPGPAFDWQLFLALYRKAMTAAGIEVGDEVEPEGTGGRKFLPLLVDGDYSHRTITEHQRALARGRHYEGAIEEDLGKDAVAGPVLWTGYQRFLTAVGFYSGRVDGDFGDLSARAEQEFLAGLRLYHGTIDGSRGTVTVKALQAALNLGRLVTGQVKVLSMPPMVNPAVGRVSSEYGPRTLLGNTFHCGIDIANDTFTDVWAAYDGTVVEVGTNIEPGRSGKAVRIRSDDGEMTYYGHLAVILVTEGQRVSRGQHIGEMGATGNVTGPHLHFEVWRKADGRSHRDPRIDFRHFGVTPGVDNRPRGVPVVP